MKEKEGTQVMKKKGGNKVKKEEEIKVMKEEGENKVEKKGPENKVMKEEKKLIDLTEIKEVNLVTKKFTLILKKIITNLILKIQIRFGTVFNGSLNQKHFLMLISSFHKL